jgi:hypothetical protein
MAVRPHERLERALVMTFNDTSQPAFTKGTEVKFDTSDTLLVATSGADVLAIGVASQANAAGRPASIAMYGTYVIPVLVGTGGATRGKLAVRVSDGFTDAATVGGGTTVQYIHGQFLQSGVAGDLVGLLVGANPSSVKA